ncbi:MAG: flagellar biosynthetic protein FliO [Phycisphaerae bacterium]|nr:flagellar biosynthetic protein FliO [Phycisphaerae bacterium]
MSYGQGIAALAVVLAMIAAATLAAKKWGGRFRTAVGGGDRNLEIVSRLALSPKQSVCLVRLGPQLVLLGVTPEQIEALTVIDDPDTVSELLAASAASARQGPGFSRLFSREASDYDLMSDEEEPAEIPLATDKRDVRRARQELSGLLDRLRSRSQSDSPSDGGTDRQDGRDRYYVA